MVKRVVGWSVAVVLLLAGCTQHTQPTLRGASPAADPRQVGSGVMVDRPLAGVRIHAARTSEPFGKPDLPAVSALYRLSPSGPLPSAVTVTLPLAQPLPEGMTPIVTTAETATGPWTYLPAAPSADRRSVTFSTDHFSLFGVLGLDLLRMLTAFKESFVDVLDGGATAEAARPTCAGENQARGDGYSIRSVSSDALYWCFGMEQGRRVLRLVDNRRYPLTVHHPGLPVREQDRASWGELASLSRLVSGPTSVLPPRTAISYDVDIPPGRGAKLTTEFDGLGQSLYALQVGLETLAAILTRFGKGSNPKLKDFRAVEQMDRLLTKAPCVEAVRAANPIAMVKECLEPEELVRMFGNAALLIVPLVVFGPLIEFFHSEFNALGDQFDGRSRYALIIAREAAPMSPAPSPPRSPEPTPQKPSPPPSCPVKNLSVRWVGTPTLSKSSGRFTATASVTGSGCTGYVFAYFSDLNGPGYGLPEVAVVRLTIGAGTQRVSDRVLDFTLGDVFQFSGINVCRTPEDTGDCPRRGPTAGERMSVVAGR